MFNKKSLSLAVAAAATGLSLNATAQIDVSDALNPNKVAVANESVTPTTTGTLPIGVGATNNALDVTGEIGIGVANNDQIFIRFDWSSAALGGDLALGSLTVTPGTNPAVPSTSLTDGLTGDSNAIFGVTAGASGFPQDASVDLDIGTTGVALTGSTSDVRMRVYESQGDAIAEAAALSDQSVVGAVSLGNALSVNFSAQTAIAEVTADFLEFKDGGGTSTTGALGSFTAVASTSFSLAADLSPVTALDNLVNTGTSSIVTYAGDFSFATSPGSYFVSGVTDGTCSTAGSTAVTLDTTTLLAANASVAAADSKALCVTVNGNDETIPEASYTGDVTLVHAVTTSVPSATADSGNIGDIDRNGTTVEVAYLTTFTDYNQRLLINSRHPVAAAYTITFQTEDGVTATANPAFATGILQPNENLVLRATDLVTLTGGTRCSATVVVVAPEDNISVATTQVNLSDASTDTVSYN